MASAHRERDFQFAHRAILGGSVTVPPRNAKRRDSWRQIRCYQRPILLHARFVSCDELERLGEPGASARQPVLGIRRSVVLKLAGPNAREGARDSRFSMTASPSQTERTSASGPNSLITCRQAPQGAVGTVSRCKDHDRPDHQRRFRACHRLENRVPLGTDRQTVRGVLDIAARENLAAIGEHGRPDAKAAVGAIGLSGRLAGRGDQIGSSRLGRSPWQASRRADGLV